MAKVYKFWFILSILYVVFIINLIFGRINTQRDECSCPDLITFVFGIQNGIIIYLLPKELTMSITGKFEIKNKFIIYCLASLSILSPFGFCFALFNDWILANIPNMVCLKLIAFQVFVIVFAFDVNKWKAFIDEYQA